MTITTAYTPFLQPYPIDAHWLWFIIPLAASLAIVYKTITTDKISQIPFGALKWTIQILSMMAIAATAIYSFTYFL